VFLRSVLLPLPPVSWVTTKLVFEADFNLFSHSRSAITRRKHLVIIFGWPRHKTGVGLAEGCRFCSKGMECYELSCSK